MNEFEFIFVSQDLFCTLFWQCPEMKSIEMDSHTVEIGAGEISHQLQVLAACPEELSSVPAPTCGGSELPVSLAAGYVTPFSVPVGTVHMLYTLTQT